MSSLLPAAGPTQGLHSRVALLSGVMRAFAEATDDYEHLLEVVAEKLAEVVKDGCVVRLLTEGGWLSPVAVRLPVEDRVSDPEVLTRLLAHVTAPHNLKEQATARRVIETGDALIVPRLDLDQMRATTSPEIVEAFRIIGIHSFLFVALRVRGESIGLLALIRFDKDSPPFSEDDRDLAQALADHAALAITNARSLQAARRELAERQRAEAALQKTEEQLRHAQKMEAVGRLAGGVAHDFNNLLSVILTYSTLLMDGLRPGDPIRDDLAEIRKAGERATSLTRQLLAFSRQQVLEPKIVSLDQVITDMGKMLQRLIGEDIELIVRSPPSLGLVKVDKGQVEQVLMNLVVNARDAMPQGGKITIETGDVDLDETYAREHVGVAAGPHVMLAVSDTGTGMDRTTQARIFEPFFTTKEKGKGTGLGLSTVFGIVKQSGGNIWVYSEPGKGTTFKVYFPQISDAGEPLAKTAPTPMAASRGTETILLVEDEEQVRGIVRAILRREGYEVLEAQGGADALLISEKHPGPIHLLLTDVVMPQMSGRDLAQRLATTRPELKVLYMSGYTDNSIVHHGILEPGIAFLQKPITPQALATKVRDVLSRGV